MFSKKKEKDMAKQGKNGNGIMPAVNLISEGTEIQGEVQSNDDIRIDGTLRGTIHSKAKVVVGSTGKVVGDIYCQSADVLGKTEGTVTVEDILYLKASAHIDGDIQTGKLVVESGAVFEGNCNMGGSKEQHRKEHSIEPKQQEKQQQGKQQEGYQQQKQERQRSKTAV